MHPRALHSQECFFPPRTVHRAIAIYFSYILRPPLEGRALHSQECFLPPRGGFNLRCTRERYIPKNVFFLREKVLIYDAPSLPRVAWLDGRKNPPLEGRALHISPRRGAATVVP